MKGVKFQGFFQQQQRISGFLKIISLQVKDYKNDLKHLYEMTNSIVAI